MIEILDGRKEQVLETGKEGGEIACEKASLAGSVSQRACVFCGSRVVLYPDSRCPPPRPRPCGLRSLYLGHPGLPFVRTGASPAEFLHRPAGRRGHLRRREEALRSPYGADRDLSSQGCLRLRHLHRRSDRRRRAGGLCAGRRKNRAYR